MKRNVDLTENSDFRALETSRPVFLQENYSISHLWDSKPQEINSGFFCRPLFFTGYVKDIKYQKQYEKEYDNSCDRCGKKFKDKPWDKQYCLCNRCAEELENDIQLDHFPYKERYSVYQDYLNTTSDRVVLELNYR